MSYKYFGGKLRRWEQLSKSDQADLLYDLLSSFTLLKSLPEAATFITDLLTSDEVKFISKRLRIAKLLLSDWKYRDIEKRLKVSQSTVAKVASWLKEKGEGFRKVISKIPTRKRIKHWSEEDGWDKFKRSHPGSFWPELMMKDWENDSIKDENKKLKQTLETLGSKDAVHHRLDEQLREEVRTLRK